MGLMSETTGTLQMQRNSRYKGNKLIPHAMARKLTALGVGAALIAGGLVAPSLVHETAVQAAPCPPGGCTPGKHHQEKQNQPKAPSNKHKAPKPDSPSHSQQYEDGSSGRKTYHKTGKDKHGNDTFAGTTNEGRTYVWYYDDNTGKWTLKFT